MYKAIIMLLAITMLTGCVNSQPGKITEKNAPENIKTFDESNVVQRINELKEGATPQVKPTGERTDTAAPTAEEKQKEVKLKDLASEYSRAELKTNFGDITISFYSQDSPITVNNFLNLAAEGFYDNTKFHRVIKDFMIQGGDPLSKDGDWSDDGTGGPDYRFADEFNAHKLVKGSLAMANSGPDTNGSQFFIVIKEATPWLDGKHTNFGQVVKGMDIVEAIEAVATNERDHPLEDVVLERIELVE